MPGGLPAAVLSLALSDDVLQDGGVVAVQGWSPRQVDRPRTEGHDERLAGRRRHV